MITSIATAAGAAYALPGATGQSAYQVAVASGFSGTPAQWLASLVGPQGEQGIQGVQGVEGSPGVGLDSITTLGTELVQAASAASARGAIAAPAKGRTNVADAAYQILATDVLVAMTKLTAARVVTLPAASSYDNTQGLVIVDESGACSPSISIEIAASGSDQIITNGAGASVVLTQAGQKTIWHPNSTGTGWTFA